MWLTRQRRLPLSSGPETGAVMREHTDPEADVEADLEADVEADVEADPEADVEADLKAIERLHQRDMAAAKAGDYRTLRSLFTDNAVSMPPGSPWLRGGDELDRQFADMEQSLRDVEILEYVQEFEEVVVLGEYAFEWGIAYGSMRVAGGEPESSCYKMMRILKKQPDGEWKVHRTIWNLNPTDT